MRVGHGAVGLGAGAMRPTRHRPHHRCGYRRGTLDTRPVVERGQIRPGWRGSPVRNEYKGGLCTACRWLPPRSPASPRQTPSTPLLLHSHLPAVWHRQPPPFGGLPPPTQAPLALSHHTLTRPRLWAATSPAYKRTTTSVPSTKTAATNPTNAPTHVPTLRSAVVPPAPSTTRAPSHPPTVAPVAIETTTFRPTLVPSRIAAAVPSSPPPPPADDDRERTLRGTTSRTSAAYAASSAAERRRARRAASAAAWGGGGGGGEGEDVAQWTVAPTSRCAKDVQPGTAAEEVAGMGGVSMLPDAGGERPPLGGRGERSFPTAASPSPPPPRRRSAAAGGGRATVAAFTATVSAAPASSVAASASAAGCRTHEHSLSCPESLQPSPLPSPSLSPPMPPHPALRQAATAVARVACATHSVGTVVPAGRPAVRTAAIAGVMRRYTITAAPRGKSAVLGGEAANQRGEREQVHHGEEEGGEGREGCVAR